METANQTLLAPTPSATVVPAQNKMLQGSVLVLIQFDVCEEINLDSLRDIFGARRQEASFKHPAPGYVRFQRPPVVEQVEPLMLESGENPARPAHNKHQMLRAASPCAPPSLRAV